MTEHISFSQFEKSEEAHLFQKYDAELNATTAQLAALLPPKSVHTESRASFITSAERPPTILHIDSYHDVVDVAITDVEQEETAHLQLTKKSGSIFMDIDAGRGLYDSLRTHILNPYLSDAARSLAAYIRDHLPAERHNEDIYPVTDLSRAHAVVASVGEAIAANQPHYSYHVVNALIPFRFEKELQVTARGPLDAQPEALHDQPFYIQLDPFPYEPGHVLYTVENDASGTLRRIVKRRNHSPEIATLEDARTAVQLAKKALDTTLGRMTSGPNF